MKKRHYLNRGSHKGIRTIFNIHTATLEMERKQQPIIRQSNNVEMICLTCNYIFHGVIRFKVHCPKCRSSHKTQWGINVRESTLNDKQLLEEGQYRISKLTV